MEVSLEIVPRDTASLQKDIALCRSFPALGCINIPDLPRFPIRPWEACVTIKNAQQNLPLIPHLRAGDFSLDKAFPLTELFRAQGITRALVIAGDPPYKAEYPCTTVALIKKLKAELPELKIYAAFDPYRTNIRYELDYLAVKEEAGAVGFMSQPFFDLRLLEIYAEYLEGKNIFWGTAPVLTAGNQHYWISRNRAIFPRSFRPDIFWNVAFARQVIDFCGRNGFNIYLMPINVDLQTYLEGIWPAE